MPKKQKKAKVYKLTRELLYIKEIKLFLLCLSPSKKDYSNINNYRKISSQLAQKSLDQLQNLQSPKSYHDIHNSY